MLSAISDEAKCGYLAGMTMGVRAERLHGDKEVIAMLGRHSAAAGLWAFHGEIPTGYTLPEVIDFFDRMLKRAAEVSNMTEAAFREKWRKEWSPIAIEHFQMDAVTKFLERDRAIRRIAEGMRTL